MLAAAAMLALAGPTFAKPIPWALNFAAKGDFTMVGDVNGDGYADLIRVAPRGNSFIDVAINAMGMKSLVPQRANSNWGKDCQAACSGEFDGVPGVDIVGVFGGDTLRLAHGFKDGGFADEKEWIKLPTALRQPHVADRGEGQLVVWDESSGKAFRVNSKDRSLENEEFPKAVVANPRIDLSQGDAHFPIHSRLVNRKGEVLIQGRDGSFHAAPGVFARPNLVSAGGVVLADEVRTGNDLYMQFPVSGLPDAESTWVTGDVDQDGDSDLVQFRFGTEAHTGSNVLIYRTISPGETDSDHDGLTNEEEARLGTDSGNPDTDGDGLLDGWEVNGFRGLDMKSLGCDPKRIDCICLCSRFSNANKDMVERQMKNIEGYYNSLGWALHPIWIDEMGTEEQKKPWWESRDRFLPAKWRGVVHWMQITPWGGGQADQLGDGGGCGGNEWSLYATFIHEFGHQLGLSHEGFYRAGACPIYSSMMNYSYSYGYEGDIKKIHYSDGSLANFVMKETDLDETLPLPYDKVKFLANGPYHFRLKANGPTTLIDWNWNGVFGEKHIRADVNYSYSTTGGRRDDVGKTQTAPWVFTHGKSAYVLFGQQGVQPDGKSDPSVLPEKPGWLFLRRLIKPFEWEKPVKIVDEGVTGDPVAISYGGEIVVAYPSTKGLAVHWLKVNKDGFESTETTVIDGSKASPALGIYKGRLFLFEWSATDGVIRYRSLTRGHRFGDLQALVAAGPAPVEVKSTVPVSMAVDTSRDEIILGGAEDQDPARPSRWCLRREKVIGDRLQPSTPKPLEANSEREWIEGEKGGSRGRSRCLVLYDEKGITGMKGRILYFGLGMTSATVPWSCAYVAQSVADKSVNNGWMVKRYYDEWTQSRSAPAAAWFNGDIIYSYRWADGSQGAGDNVLHVAYNGTGIENVPMGDFNDIGFMRDFGIRHSILYLRQ